MIFFDILFSHCELEITRQYLFHFSDFKSNFRLSVENLIYVEK